MRASSFAGRVVREVEVPLVFIVVAIDAEQLPVAAVGRIMVVVVVFVVDRQHVHCRAIELPGASTTNPREHLERLPR